MNKKTHIITRDYKLFFSFLLGNKIPTQKISLKNERLVMDEHGSISMNYSNPEVLKGIEKRINEFQDIPLSTDIRTNNEKMFG